MPNVGQDVELGEAWEDSPIALVYAATAADGAKWTASTSFERVLTVKGGGPTSDSWQATLGANWSNSTCDGADLTETSVALIASYGVIAKRLAVNFGLWQVEPEDQGTTVQDTRLGTGLTFPL